MGDALELELQPRVFVVPELPRRYSPSDDDVFEHWVNDGSGRTLEEYCEKLNRVAAVPEFRPGVPIQLRTVDARPEDLKVAYARAYRQELNAAYESAFALYRQLNQDLEPR